MFANCKSTPRSAAELSGASGRFFNRVGDMLTLVYDERDAGFDLLGPTAVIAAWHLKLALELEALAST